MSEHKIGTREEWLAARLELLEREKELTRQSDEIALQRRELPWVAVEKPYSFETEEGTKTLGELFDGRSQLLVYHFMFGPSYEAGCPSCSSIADGFDGFVVHLQQRGVTMVCVSRAPLEKLQAYKRRMGWTFPWVSSSEDFNLDYQASWTDEQLREGARYNYRTWTLTPELETAGPVVETAASCGTVPAQYLKEAQAVSAFARSDGDVYHTYSAYSRGVDGLWGVYQWLDRAPGGRGEDLGWVRHDEY